MLILSIKKEQKRKIKKRKAELVNLEYQFLFTFT